MSWFKAAPAKIGRWARRVLIAFDQLGNTVLGGDPDDTFSSRCWRKAQAGQWFWRFLRALVDLIFFWEPDHCRLSYESEVERRHLPAEFRSN